MQNGYLIVGLGNPGNAYAETRHNIGFLLVDELARRWRLDWKSEKRLKVRWARGEHGGRRIGLCQPQTYMNLSGEAVRAVSDYFRIVISALLVVVDDADLPFGTLRLRPGGSSGGHRGLASIEEHLGSRDYARLRIGIGRTGQQTAGLKGYVLGRFNPEERERLPEVLKRAADQVECWLTNGIQSAMSRFNGPLNGNEEGS